MPRHSKDQWMGKLRVRIERTLERGCSRSDLVKAKKGSPSRKAQEEALRALEKESAVFAVGPKTRPRYIGRPLIERLYAQLQERRDTGAHVEITEQQLRDFYEMDRHRREGLASLPILWTWQRYVDHCRNLGATAEIELFHESLGRLARSGRIDLVAHDDPSRLGPEERALLRPREDGSLPYYWMPRDA
jgi:hypothetical protein